MQFTLYQKALAFKRSALKTWYWLMKPIAFFFTIEKENKRYQKKRAKITEEKAVRWIAEDMTRHVLKTKSNLQFLICDYASEEDFWAGCSLATTPYYLKRKKTRMASFKFVRDIPFQEKVVEQLKSYRILSVQEEQKTYPLRYVKNYQKTVTICPK